MSPSPAWPGARALPEVPRGDLPGDLTVWVHPEWGLRFPWLAQGVTGRPADFALFREAEPPVPPVRWLELARGLGFPAMVHAKQIHEARVLVHASVEADLVVGPDADGHATRAPGVLMGVTVADCVPVYLVDSGRKATGLVHAGWRGIAAGILEGAVRRMGDAFGSQPRELSVHLGPSICGDCYEVGPEVHRSLGLPDPGKPTPVDLRGVLGERALKLGVPGEEITRSAYCTRCGDSPFFSHRRGDGERQVAFLGIRSSPGAGLCVDCSWSRAVVNRRGSRFVLCRRSEEDPGYPRYPQLPVTGCDGFQDGPANGGGGLS